LNFLKTVFQGEEKRNIQPVILKNQPHLLAVDPVITNETLVTSMGGTTLTSRAEEMPTLIWQAWCREKAAAPPHARVRQANCLTTPNLKQFSVSLQVKAGHQICFNFLSGQTEKAYAPDGTTEFVVVVIIIIIIINNINKSNSQEIHYISATKTNR
jgi:hypothetical protein